MLFYEISTPDGFGIPGVHGAWAADELDGNVQGGSYLIVSAGEALLVDTGNRVPGTDVSMGPALIGLIERSGARLTRILITHFHYDHTGNAAEIRERYGAEVLAHPLERPIIEDPLILTRAENAERFGLSPQDLLADFSLAQGESLGLSDPAIIDRYWNFPVPVDREVSGGDVIRVGELSLEVVDLAGHSPGQIGLWNPATRSLYAADIGHPLSPLSPFPIGDARTHIQSLQRARALGAEFLWEGHGLGAYDAAAVARRLDHYLASAFATGDRILDLLRAGDRPLSILDLLPEVYPVKTEWNYPVPSGVGQRWAYAEACIQCHLQLLVELGAASRIRDPDCARFTLADGFADRSLRDLLEDPVAA